MKTRRVKEGEDKKKADPPNKGIMHHLNMTAFTLQIDFLLKRI